MKILVVASESVNTSEVVAHALQTRFEQPNSSSPFLLLRTSLNSSNQMVAPNYLPFLLEAEFSKHAQSHRLFDKKLYDKNPIQNFEAAADNIVGIIPVASINALEIKRRLERHGFDVTTSLVDFKSEINEKTSYVTTDSNGDEFQDDGFYDLHVSDETLRATVSNVGDFVCQYYGIGIGLNTSRKNEMHVATSSNPIVETARFLQIQSLKVAATLNGGKTINQQKVELIDDYLVELKRADVKSFEDLPHASKVYILEQSYILKLINSYDMRNILENSHSDLKLMAPDMAKLLSYAEMLQIAIDSVQASISISDLTYQAKKVDNILSNFQEVVHFDSSKSIPKSVQAAIDETASNLLGVNGLMKSNDKTNSVSYNSAFPASHALEEFLQFYGDSVHTNIQNNEQKLSFRMQ